MSTKISQLTSATDVTANDLVQIVDVEDGVMAPSGTNKKVTASLLAKELAKQPLEPGVVISGSSAGDAVRITQIGSGNALVVEDSSNPDSTPFKINSNGQLLMGAGPHDVRSISIITNSNLNQANNGNIGTDRYSNENNGVYFSQNKGRGTYELPIIVQNSDELGRMVWRGSDAITMCESASISAYVDGNTSSNNIPGCLVISTASNGNNTERMRINSIGNVGIGTNDPGSKLEVNGNIASKTGSQFGGVAVRNANYTVGYMVGTSVTNDDGRFGLLSNNVDKVMIQANGDSYFRGGNVGIGTNGPQVNLHLSSANSGWVGGLMLENTLSNQKFVLSSRVDLSSPARFSISNETRFNEDLSILASNGYVGIGVLNPQYQLQLGLDSAAKPSTSTWTVSSDERLKENIEAADLDICYNAVKNIPLKRYKWKDEVYSDEQVSDRSKIGWIAQDVQAVFPKAVGQHKFTYNQVKDDDGNLVSEDSIDDCLSLNSDQLYAAMFGAVQKLILTIEALQDRVNQLEQT